MEKIKKVNTRKVAKLNTSDFIKISNKKIPLTKEIESMVKALPKGYQLEDLNKGFEKVRKMDGFENRKIHEYTSNLLTSKTLEEIKKGVYHRFNFDVYKFRNYIEEKLLGHVAGFCIQVRQNGKVLTTIKNGMAQNSQDGNIAWSPDIRMHIASCSKFYAAVALVKAMKARNISYDAKIADYLPRYWKINDEVRNTRDEKGVTFRDLMRHESGFSPCSDESTSYLTMKAMVTKCVRYNGYSRYENINFNFLRILVPIIAGVVDINMYNSSLYESGIFSTVRDVLWDSVTKAAFKNYQYEHIFKPANIPFIVYEQDLSTNNKVPADLYNKKAFGYKFQNSNQKGWVSDPQLQNAGSVGIRTTVNEMLDILGTIRRTEKIIKKSHLNEMLNNSFGIFLGQCNKGEYFRHNGWWQSGSGEVEQSAQFFFPEDIEIVGLANSSAYYNQSTGKVGHSIEGYIFDAYQQSFGS